MSPKVIRWAATLLCLAVGIPGMIVSSITSHDGAAVTFGLLAAVGSLCLIVLSAATRYSPDAAGPAHFDESDAADVEQRIDDLVSAGADEDRVRDLVRAAVRLGRSSS